MDFTAGEIVIKSGVDVWDHEMKTAQALANAGHTIIFLKRREGDHVRTPDMVMDDIVWEMKSPLSNRLPHVQKTIRRALHQSSNIVYDSQRIKNLNDTQIKKELDKCACQFRTLKHLVFVNKKREVIVIK